MGRIFPHGNSIFDTERSWSPAVHKIAEERVEIVGSKGKKIGWKTTQEVTVHSIGDLKNSWDGPRDEKAVLIQQQRLQHAPRQRDGDTSTSTSK